MSVFHLFAALTSVAAVLAWANYRFIRLPMTIGLMVLSLGCSVLIVLAGHFGVAPIADLSHVIRAIDFDDTVLNGMLGALLFAGALHLDLGRLIAHRGLVLVLATGSVLLTTFIVGVGGHYLFALIGLNIPLPWMLVFGALIAPTDPIAVGAILRRVGVPKELETVITGESLFNDGVGVVLFILLVELLAGETISAPVIGKLIAIEVLGGIVYGAAIGWIVYRMLRAVDNYQVEILLTLAVVTGGYALAHALHVSGPLAMVVAGLLIGNRGREFAMSETTRHRLDQFWELIDEFLNAVLFVLMGLEVVILDMAPGVPFAAAIAIPLVLVARLVSVAGPVALLPSGRRLPRGASAILTWSGLRGGISVALALSLPQSPFRDKLIMITYIIVCFSIIVQGLTVGKVTSRILARHGTRHPASR